MGADCSAASPALQPAARPQCVWCCRCCLLGRGPGGRASGRAGERLRHSLQLAPGVQAASQPLAPARRPAVCCCRSG